MSTKKLKGKLTISRPTGTKFDVINIALNDDTSGVECVDIELGLEDFARALTGQGFIPCTFEWRPSVVGMLRETKYEIVPFKPYTSRGNQEAIAEALAPFEIDGWEARREDLFNHHYSAGPSAQRVLFVRYVPVEQEVSA